MKAVDIEVKYPECTKLHHYVCDDADKLVWEANVKLPDCGFISAVTVNELKATVQAGETCKTRDGRLVLVTGVSGEMAYGYLLKETPKGLKPYGGMHTWWISGAVYKFTRPGKFNLDLVESIDRGITFDIM